MLNTSIAVKIKYEQILLQLLEIEPIKDQVLEAI